MLFMLSVLLMLPFLQLSSSRCQESHRIICDTIPDVEDFDADDWNDLEIGNTAATTESLYQIDDNFFSKFRNLHSLTIINQISSIRTNFTITFLDHLNLHGNNLDYVNLNTFNKFVDLRKLILSKNKIKIMDNVYNGPSLRFLDLSNNQLEKIRRNIFVNSSVKWLNLRHNQLSIIEPNALPLTLIVLNLDYNNLFQLDDDIVENLDQLEELTLSHNALASLPRIKGIPKVKYLDFSFNQLTRISDVFSAFSDLKYLDLSNNKIVRFDYDLRHTENLYWNIKISLAFNKLTVVDYYALIVLFGHTNITNREIDNTLSFYGNPLQCDCLERMSRYFFNYYIKRSSCDIQYFNSGNIPVCIPSSGQCDEKYPIVNDTDYETFRSVYEKSQRLIRCNIAHGFYENRTSLLKHESGILIS